MKILTVFFGSFGIMNGTRTDNDNDTVILSLKDIRALLTSLGRGLLRSFRLW
jgi:hypothetical protein